MKSKFFNNKLIILIVIVLILITFLTKYYGSTDIGDCSDVAKFFAGKYNADIRRSHSYLFGYILSPFVKIFNSFIFFKISSLLFLFLIIYSVYILSSKDKRTLFLILLSPVIWYMAPWISSIQIASFLFLWSYYFIRKYNSTEKLKYLLYSGILIGLGWAFWDTVLYFGIFLILSFLYNKKVSHVLLILFAIFIGLIPRLILDQLLFNFAFLTTIKTFVSGFISLFFQGIYAKSGFTTKNFLTLISIFLSIPLYFWVNYKPSLFKKNKKTIIFLTLSILLILTNPQIRYILIIAPIIILLLGKNLNGRSFRIQSVLSLIILILFISPYIIQVKYSTGEIYGSDFTSLFGNINKLKLEKYSFSDLILQDLENITQEYPNQTFLVGNQPDDYQILAHYYWGKDIKEFVSIQDYNLWKENETIIFEKTFMPSPNIDDRRQIWLSGGISKNENDNTNYSEIKFAIGINKPIELEGAVVADKYNILYLSKISK